MSDAELRDPVEIINIGLEGFCTKKMVLPQPWRDPIVVYGVSLLIVAALSFYGGFRQGVYRKAATETQVTLAIGRACIDYVHGLRPRKVAQKPEAAAWIANNCERIAQRSIERINGMKTGEIVRKP